MFHCFVRATNLNVRISPTLYEQATLSLIKMLLLLLNTGMATEPVKHLKGLITKDVVKQVYLQLQ